MSDAVYIVFSARVETTSIEMLYKSILDRVQIGDSLCLIIASHGGDCALALAAARFIDALPCEVTTYNASVVDSASIVLFAAGKRRYLTPGSRFLPHPLSASPDGSTLALPKLKSLVHCLEQETLGLATYLASHTSISANAWIKKMDASTCLNEDEAYSIGLIHGTMELPTLDPQKTVYIH